jgi:hypothetical protein
MVVVLGVPDNNSISPIVITPVGTHTLASASPSTRYGSKLLVGRLESEFLSMIDQTKKDFEMNGWIHMPRDSEEYEYVL